MKLSLPVKFAALALVIAGFGVIGIALYSFQDAASLLREQSIQRLAREMNLVTLLFNEKTEKVRADLTNLIYSDPLHGHIRAVEGDGYDERANMTEALWKQRLINDFTNLLKQRLEYDKIRYIGIADEGMEIIRVKYREGHHIITVPRNELQHRVPAIIFRRRFCRNRISNLSPVLI